MKGIFRLGQRKIGFGVLLAGFLAPGVCMAQTVQTELQKLTPTDVSGGCGAGFGRAVAIEDDWVAVGAPGGIFAGCRGSVYLFHREVGTWVEDLRFRGGVWSLGASVAMSGGLLAAGDPAIALEATGSAGSVQTWRLEGGEWVNDVPTLRPKNSAADDGFGRTMSLDAERLVVGAGVKSVFPAYVFRREAGVWVEEAALMGSDSISNDYFGSSVAISGDVIIVGAPFHSIPLSRAGAVYVFRRNGTIWTQEAKLSDPNVSVDGVFGLSVSILDDTILAGAASGVHAFRFVDGEWAEEGKLVANDAAFESSFGSSLALGKDVGLVGADLAMDGENISGAAYIFFRGNDGWSQSSKLIPSNPAFAAIGTAVSLEDVAIVGNGGSGVWVFSMPKPIPTVGVWGVVIMAMLTLTGGSVVARRRRSRTRA